MVFTDRWQTFTHFDNMYVRGYVPFYVHKTMAAQKKNKNIRKLTKLGGHTIAVSIPIEIIRKLKWRERQKVTVKLRGKKITIEDWPTTNKKTS